MLDLSPFIYILLILLALGIAAMIRRLSYAEGYEDGRQHGVKELIAFMDHAVTNTKGGIVNESGTRKELDHEERTSTADDGDRDGDRSDMCDFG